MKAIDCIVDGNFVSEDITVGLKNMSNPYLITMRRTVSQVGAVQKRPTRANMF